MPDDGLHLVLKSAITRHDARRGAGLCRVPCIGYWGGGLSRSVDGSRGRPLEPVVELIKMLHCEYREPLHVELAFAGGIENAEGQCCPRVVEIGGCQPADLEKHGPGNIERVGELVAVWEVKAFSSSRGFSFTFFARTRTRLLAGTLAESKF
jgi:hypothetical protein